MERPLWPAHWTALSELHFAVVRAETQSIDGRYVTRLRRYTHDQDGDLVLPRRGDLGQAAIEGDVVQILMLHAGETSIAQVGLQLWSGALILSEYILAHPNLFKSYVILELGAGLALPSLCASKAGALRVYATDYATEILTNCTENLALNTRYLAGATPPFVRRLDWLAQDPFASADASGAWDWKKEDRAALLQDLIIMAADVVYDERLTNGTVCRSVSLTLVALYEILCDLVKTSNAVLYLSIERRVNFTVADMAPTAAQYDYFFKRIHRRSHPCPQALLLGTQISVTFPQQFHYERTEQLELWRIERNSPM